MLIDALRTMHAFDRWATEQMLTTAERLTPEQWLTPGTAGQGSVRDTLVHAIAAHRNWVGICDGSLTAEQAFSGQPDPSAYPDVAAVRTFWQPIDTATRAYLAQLDEAEAAGHRSGVFPWSGESFSVPVWTILLHVVTHSTQHRSEVAAMLTDFGCSPGIVDLLGFSLGISG